MREQLRRVSVVILLGFVALTAQGQGQGQVADGDQIRPPTFRTDVNYVRVDVFVTRDGELVTDLRPEEFQILDEDVPQEIAQFEYVRIRGNVPQESLREPNTLAESREMLQDPRARVFTVPRYGPCGWGGLPEDQSTPRRHARRSHRRR